MRCLLPLGSSPAGRSEDELAALELDVTGAALLEAASGRASQTLAAADAGAGAGTIGLLRRIAALEKLLLLCTIVYE